ncbi:MAG: hypothetical protein IKK78_01340 [Oscillospiraceae bacterium]|nr:hypothetical protein [Oscillospiraceae bacterium]
MLEIVPVARFPRDRARPQAGESPLGHQKDRQPKGLPVFFGSWEFKGAGGATRRSRQCAAVSIFFVKKPLDLHPVAAVFFSKRSAVFCTGYNKRKACVFAGNTSYKFRYDLKVVFLEYCVLNKAHFFDMI